METGRKDSVKCQNSVKCFPNSFLLLNSGIDEATTKIGLSFKSNDSFWGYNNRMPTERLKVLGKKTYTVIEIKHNELKRECSKI